MSPRVALKICMSLIRRTMQIGPEARKLWCRAMHGGKKTLKVVHRVALFDNSSRITHIVSQSDIARWALFNFCLTDCQSLSAIL